MSFLPFTAQGLARTEASGALVDGESPKAVFHATNRLGNLVGLKHELKDIDAKIEAMTVKELITWRSSSSPISKQFASSPLRTRPKLDVNEPLDKISPNQLHQGQNAQIKTNRDWFGQYQFRPFPFQSPIDTLQSGTTKALLHRGMFQGNPLPSADPASMMTMKGQMSYNASHLQSYDVIGDVPGGDEMVDLSGYKDLTKPPITENGGQFATSLQDDYRTETESSTMNATPSSYNTAAYSTHPEVNDNDVAFYEEYSGNVKTLVQLVNDLPEGVTKQTGAQIIRLTMEAMGISMETVLSDAQTVQSQLLDAVRSNIKKIEEYKTVIRKLESEIRFHQGKANELSEIIDLFILSNTSPKMPAMDGVEDHY